MSTLVCRVAMTVGMLLATPAGAVTVVAGAPDSGPVDVTASYAPGYSSYNFDGGTSPFTGGGVETTSSANQYDRPFGDSTPYFSVGPSTSTPATLALSGINQLSFYWGSIDTYNSITFNGLGVTIDGAALGATDPAVHRVSREVTFKFTPAEAAAITGITLHSGTNAFELDNLVFGTAVPEPATWGTMILGLGLIGGLARRHRRGNRQPAPAC